MATSIGSWFVEVAPSESDQDVRLFQNVPDEKMVKNRVHLDLTLESEDREAEIDRLVALGATRVQIGQTGEESWTVLADPEGNEFCLIRPKKTLIS